MAVEARTQHQNRLRKRCGDSPVDGEWEKEGLRASVDSEGKERSGNGKRRRRRRRRNRRVIGTAEVWDAAVREKPNMTICTPNTFVCETSFLSESVDVGQDRDSETQKPGAYIGETSEILFVLLFLAAFLMKGMTCWAAAKYRSGSSSEKNGHPNLLPQPKTAKFLYGCALIQRLDGVKVCIGIIVTELNKRPSRHLHQTIPQTPISIFTPLTTNLQKAPFFPTSGLCLSQISKLSLVDMGEIKPSVSTPSPNEVHTSSSSVDVLQLRFMELCKKILFMDAATYSSALNLFRDTKHLLLANTSVFESGTGEEAVRYWCAFVLYSTSRLTEGSEERSNSHSRLNLCQILKAAELNMVDFFKEIPHFIVKAGPILGLSYGKNWENRLEAKELQANFVHLSHLSKYYKRAYSELFLAHEAKACNESDGTNTNNKVSDYQRFGWLLFLALRVHAFGRIKNIVTCMNGLVSILVIMIVHMPPEFRNFTLSDSSRFVRRSDRGVDLIASLCKIYETSEDEVKKTLEAANNLISVILKKKPSFALGCKVENLQAIDSDGLIYFEDLMGKSSLSSSISALEKDYEDAVLKGELDERVFLNEEDSLLGSGTLSGGAINMTGTKRKFDAFSSPSKTITSPLSPFRSPSAITNGTVGSSSSIRLASATPVTTAMTTAKWLRTVVSPLPSEPSTELKKFLASCDKDVTDDVMRRVHVILEAIFPNTVGEHPTTGGLPSANLMDNIWAEQRRLEATKLYYRVLEAMCRAEAQILHSSNLTSLLMNDRFHRCMLACSAELVLATHKTVTMLFPAVLERTGITAFDLSKVIESFIRHEESLPRELRRHLNTLEERLLERMVWEKGSSMYNSLIVAKPVLAAEINRLGLLAEPMPSLDAISMHSNYSSGGLTQPVLQKNEASGQNGDIRSPKRTCVDYRSGLVERNSFTSPVKDRLLAFSGMKSKLPPPPLQSAFASPTRQHPGGGGETCAEMGISILSTKITKLAAVRINSMLERLQLSRQIKESVYSLFKQILTLQTSLFFNRHIDQIILCCFYGVAKISQTSLTFKEIINNYRKQPHCKPQVFRNVFVDWSSAPWNGKSGHDHVDIITFYNEMFIPSVKPLLVELGPGRSLSNSGVTEVGSKSDAQHPGSPNVSTFPNLPDMSPKKISASHNVYISPLRSSKMDASISHSSRSYYACVGESTNAYQSPSKDLAAINDRLNGNHRRVRGTLNFDADAGLVSDSVVANSLCLQKGNCASPSGSPVLERTAS
ncbi:hypothetical protein MLD38_038218 [Melastoma candidum]|uniref:Uncharacterized protein n=1 Tax=Melastoma candidum TaxID=119954 RepID=A0ACB9KZ27_9MYRT|nr:hypothetical protein MLD38_038218 [Melastoma candidum]